MWYNAPADRIRRSEPSGVRCETAWLVMDMTPRPHMRWLMLNDATRSLNASHMHHLGICEPLVKWKERSSFVFPPVDFIGVLGLGLVLVAQHMLVTIHTTSTCLFLERLYNLLGGLQEVPSMSCIRYAVHHTTLRQS